MASLASNLACQDFPISWRDDMGLVVGFEDKDSALLLAVYVDDFKMAGPEKSLQKGWDPIPLLLWEDI